MSLPARMLLLALAGAVTTAAPRAGDVEFEARFLSRPGLPEDFHFPVLELNYQVLRVLLHNRSGQPWRVPETVLLTDPGGKRLKRVAPIEMTPRIVESKLFRARQYRTEQGSAAGVPIPPHPAGLGRYPQGRAAGPAHVHVGAAGEVRETLERHHLPPGELAPGESLEALVYVRSKKKHDRLRGSRVLLGDLEIRTR